MIAGYERELGHFQLDIAKRWLRRGEDVSDAEAKLFFYYTAFNALFFYWKLVDGVGRSEHRQIENLVRKLGEGSWDRLLSEAPNEVRFFKQREPIQKMDERSPDDPREGDAKLGQQHRSVLMNPGASSLDKLVALAKILYIVRCNLCHGSKGVLGDDRDVIRAATPLLRVLAEEALRYTEPEISGG
jgi:hypothetical protein